MEDGLLIKYERKKQNIKQEVLARSICSPSYLSKIENGAVIPSREIIDLLLTRLDIMLSKSITVEFMANVRSTYKDIVTRRDKVRVAPLLNDIRNHWINFPHPPYKIELLLIEARLNLMVGENTEESAQLVSLLHKFKTGITHHQHINILILEGILDYMAHQFHSAKTTFETAFKLSKMGKVEEWETADIHYLLSLAEVSLYNSFFAIDYAMNALSYFEKEVIPNRIIDCLLTISIAQKHVGRIDEAISNLIKAKNIVKENKEGRVYLSKIEHNLGSCYSLISNKELSTFHFYESLKLKENANDKIVTIFALIKNFKKFQNNNESTQWLNKGVDLLDELTESNRVYYSNHFEFYNLTMRNDNDFESRFKEILTHFEENKDYTHCFLYCQVIGDKFKELHKYKAASDYYNLAFKYLLKQRNIMTWEEFI